MAEILNNDLYRNEIKKTENWAIPWEMLEGRSFLISGASGQIGSFLVDVLMHHNERSGHFIQVTAITRNLEKAAERFAPYIETGWLQLLEMDINQEKNEFPRVSPDYVFHLASNTHPVSYATDPIGTVLTNILGTKHMLDLGYKGSCRRFIFASSVEIYGENRDDCDRFSEDYCGYLDCNTLRAGYPESKRAGEALCQAYIRQKEMNIVIPRLARIYGPTLLKTDTKALSQFLQKGICGEDIVLKSDGTQYYSYLYVADAVSALLYLLCYGENGQAYNVSDPASDIHLKDLAQLIADYANRKVIYELPDEVEKTGYSKATKAIMENRKLRNLGWKAEYTMEEGIHRTMDIRLSAGY